ncbi:MAG: 2OG-Fe(II) oxygenase, partial [Myxococcota bacterium]
FALDVPEPPMHESPSPLLREIDAEALAASFRKASPTRFFVVDDFLDADFARAVAAAYPSFEQARGASGAKEFARLNEDVKVQVTDAARFPEPVRRLSDLLASDAFLAWMSRVTGIAALQADPDLAGGGMHVMGPSGYLGVHVDFNFLRARQLFRRLNIIVYLTPDWRDDWDGSFELWDPKVKHRLHAFAPRFNRCMVFNTTQESFHGVRAIRCPSGATRNSFAAFYYTAEPPDDWNGRHHSTIYKARPDEWSKRLVSMPLAAVRKQKDQAVRGLRRAVRRFRS